MSSGFRQIYTLISALLISIIMPAQEIPVLPADPAVLQGVMPNGMAYYLVSNPTVKNTADFALVQKAGRCNVDDSTGMLAVSAARDALACLPRLKPSSPQEYLSRHGIFPGAEGYVEVSDDATLYHLENVGVAALDSTLLFLMDIADRVTGTEDEFLARWYPPADQAIIVSGDIDSKNVASKLSAMSYMTPARPASPHPEYVWNGEADSVFARSCGTDGISEISMRWVSQRPPREFMNTVQPAIFEMAVNALGEVAKDMLFRAFREEGIAVADISYDFVSSGRTSYDDSFTIRVSVADVDAGKALEIAASVMAGIDTDGAGMGDYLNAEARYFERMAEAASVVVKDNAEYVSRCADAFLSNSSLASPNEKLRFHKSRHLPDTMRLRLFNDIALALLDSSVNLTVRCPEDEEVARHLFSSAWRKGISSGNRTADVHVPALPEGGAKVRIRSSKKEHVSGGTIWTFSNGFKVIYRQMKADRMYYNLAINGGYAAINGLEPGEGAYVTDYLKSCDICGMEAGRFVDMLKRKGVSMEAKVNLSNTMISGHAPEDEMGLLLRALLAAVNERTRNDEHFAYQRDCGYLALDLGAGSFESRMTAIDSIMCPDYRYSPYKIKGRISSDFQDKVEAFLDDMSSKMNDGALVLVGDMDEAELKEILLAYAGGFRTADVAFRRPVVRYQPVSGWSTYTMEGDMDNVDVALSARMPVTAENCMAADIASMLLKRRLAQALEGTDMYLTLSYNCRIYPEERLNVLISVSEADPEGFASGTAGKNPIDALSEIRSVLSDLNEMEISEEMLSSCKTALKDMIENEMKDPRYWTDAITLRYLDGKDLSTDYAAKIKSVTADRVLSVLGMLNEGCKVEYVISKRQ